MSHPSLFLCRIWGIENGSENYFIYDNIFLSSHNKEFLALLIMCCCLNPRSPLPPYPIKTNQRIRICYLGNTLLWTRKLYVVGGWSQLLMINAFTRTPHRIQVLVFSCIQQLIVVTSSLNMFNHHLNLILSRFISLSYQNCIIN